MALASPSDVSAAIGRQLSGDEVARAILLLESASRVIETKTGRRFEPGSYTVGRKVRRGRVMLPAANPTVTAVRSVDQRTGTTAVVAGDDWNVVGATLYVRSHPCFVQVDFTTEDPVPDAIIALAAGVVGGLITMPAAGVTSEMAGPYQVTFGNNSGRIFFSASDQEVIDSYRLPTYPVSLP